MLECLGEQLSILVSEDLVAGSACGEHLLPANDFDLVENGFTLTFEDGLKHFYRVIYQVRESLIKRAFWRHINGLKYELSRISIESARLNLLNQVVQLMLGEKGISPYKLQIQSIFGLIFKAKIL